MVNFFKTENVRVRTQNKNLKKEITQNEKVIEQMLRNHEYGGGGFADQKSNAHYSMLL